jgi:hypothetical protein
MPPVTDDPLDKHLGDILALVSAMQPTFTKLELTRKIPVLGYFGPIRGLLDRKIGVE